MKIGKISIVNGMLIAILIINCNYAQTTPPGFGIYHPCVNHSVIISNSNRTINYTLQNGEHDDCESSYITAGWYRYEMLQNIPTKPPLAGQCGSSSPIWLNGTYPVIPYKNHSMLACKVGSSSNCEDSWNITVQNCLTFNVIYLEPFPSCGRYCMEGMSEDCESSNLTAGWYRYDGFQNIPTTPPSPGQCGSSSPIWLNGTYPDMPGMITPMTACAVSYSSSCQESWPVKALNCYSYNVVYLQPNGNCSKYCMNSQTYQMPTGSENCYTAAVIESTDDRTVEYDLMMNEIEKCDNITEGWYRFQENQNILNYPPSIGQCSSRAPIWLEGKYPTTYGETKTMKACMVSNNTNCENKGNVTVMNCYSYNVAYLTSLNGCGRICMEQMNSSGTTPPTMNHPCYSTSVIEGTYDRTFNYILQPGEVEDCDNITEGWYTFASGQSVPTTSPVPGQCGSRSPIWFSGTYPTSFEETTTMKACMVSNFSNCEDSWNVTVMHCYGYNVAYMKEINDCGRVCMEQMNSSGTTPPTMNHPCYSTSVIEGTYDRTFNYILQPGEVEDCDNITEGWYILQVNRMYPLRHQYPGNVGTYPTSFEETTTMKACMVSNFSNCEDSWNVTVMHCYGYNVAYMKEINDCGRVCMEQMNSSGTTPPTMNHPCYSTSVIEGTYDRTFNYILQPGEVEDCDNITEGWYTFASQQNVPTTPPVPGQCGSRSPVWFSGTYPTSFEETTTIKACMVSNFTNCEDSWNVTVMHCYGYNVAYMKELNDCGRVCMESNEAFNETTNQHSSTVHPSQSFIHNASVSQENLEASYTSPYSSFQPHATTVMSDTFSGEPAPYSEYLPSETNHFYETASYDKTYSEYQSFDQLSSTVSSRNIQPTTVSDVSQPTSFPSTESTTPFNMYPQTTPPGNGNYHPCLNHSLITSYSNRTINYTLQNGEHDDCESSYLTAGWYRYEMLQNIPTKAPLPGQCGSSSPIWLNGTYSTNFGEYRSMSACQVGNSSICEKSWNVTVLSCMTFNVVYLEPVVSSCGRYCMEPEWTNPSWYGPCFYDHTIITGDYTRTIDYVLSEGMSEDCESSNLTAGWYRYDGFQNIPNTPPRPGQCGSSSPIWLNGSSPSLPGESTTMTACAVSESSTCQESWPVTMLNCYNYNVAYLEPNGNCSRYCMVSNDSYNQSINQSSSTIHFSQSQSYEPTVSLENLNDSYTLPHSGYQPHATSAMSDTWSKDTMNSAPSSGYQPHATPVMSDKWSQDAIYSTPNSGYPPYATPVMSDKWSHDTIYSASSSGYQPNPTPVMSEKWSQNTMYSAPSSGYQPHATPVMSAKWSQDTMNSAPSSGYQPHATPVMSDKLSQETMFSAPNSGYQPHATPVMSNKWSQDTMHSSPNSEYPPHATPVMSDTWSQDTMLTAPNSGYQPHATPVMSDTWSQDTMFSAPNSGYQPHATPVTSDKSSQDTMYSAPNSGYQPHATQAMSDTSTQDTMYSAQNSGYQPHATPVISDKWSQDTMYSATNSGYPQSNTNYFYLSTDSTTPLEDNYSFSETIYPSSSTTSPSDVFVHNSSMSPNSSVASHTEPNRLSSTDTLHQTASSETLYSEPESHYQSTTESWNIQPTSALNEMMSTTSLAVESTTQADEIVLSDFLSLSVDSSVPTFNPTSTDRQLMFKCKYYQYGSPILNDLLLDVKWEVNDVLFVEKYNLTLSQMQTEGRITKTDLKNAGITMGFNVKCGMRLSASSNSTYLESYPRYAGMENIGQDECRPGCDGKYILKLCYIWYDFHDEGEFSLFRHKTKPIEVNTIQRRFESHHSWTEHCAIAVRAASDVFIIYGCGRPTKWIVRRLGCQTGSEYLEVYHRWGTYEIVLPTGTRVYVWIAMNRRLNVYITFSRKDRYQTEGLCGTWNNNWEDDFTGRDGIVYDRAYPFARTWSVPASDSLFIAKTRTEKLSQSFMYCTCLGDSGGTLNGLSANVDCSWKESLPVCPPLNFGKQSCSIRSKRSTDEDDDDLTIDISPDILTKKEHTERTSEWINGWNESSADDACNSYFKNSGSYDDCSSLSNVNVSSAITNCVLNIKVSGTDEYMADAFEMFKTECSNEIRTNNSLWNETNDAGNIVAQVVVGKLCPFDCKYKGIQLGDCVQDLTGGDCRVNMSASPQILTNITDESFCDTSKRSCSHISVFGENFYESSNLGCLLQKAEIINNVLTANGTSSTTTGQMENIGEVKCLVSVNRRRKRSTTNETIQYYLVSVTNDGVTYSDSVPLILYDTSCYTCTTTDSNVNCQLRSDICVVDGICYSSSSSQCSSDESTGSKLWIIGIVISVLLVVIIVILLVKWCKSPRRVFPLCGEDNADKPSSSELYEAVSRGNTPEPMTRNDFHQVLVHHYIPKPTEEKKKYDECSYLAFNSSTVLFDNESRPLNFTKVKCTKWVYDDAIFASTFSSEMNLVCDDFPKTTQAKTLFFGGVLVGAFITGMLSDKIGRKKTLFLSFFLALATTVGLAFSPSYPVFVTLRFFVGFSMAGIFMTAFVIGLELVGPTKRNLAGIVIEYFFALGLVLLAGVAYLLRDWFYIELAFGAPMVLFLLMWWVIPESPRWLINQGRKEEAEVILRKAAKVNKVTLPDKLFMEEDEEEPPTGHLLHLFTSRVLLVRTLVIFFNWMVVSMTYYGLSLNTGNLGGDFYMNFFISGLVEFPAYTLSILFLDRIGRKICHLLAMVIGELQWLTTTLAMIGKLGSAAAFAIIYVFSAELYPTVVRNTGMGASSCCARVGGMIAPYVADSVNIDI
ncbi:OCTN [Mytilus edulis]|uniref:SLC22A4_5 n=1 Tax=Mytilus edulis TaxID=6550 RepID=A0A8S3SW47_MYTED|nr:OCTN [Mytilus edulis]